MFVITTSYLLTKSKYGNKFTIRDYHRGQLLQFIQLNTPYKIAVEYHKDDAIFGSRQYLMDTTPEAFVDVALWGFETVANMVIRSSAELLRHVTKLFGLSTLHMIMLCAATAKMKMCFRFTLSHGFTRR